MIGTQLLDESWRRGVPKFVAIRTICAYPKFTPVPFREENLWDGYPEETNAPVWAGQEDASGTEPILSGLDYEYNSIFLLPVNLYGPGDNFDLETSHVIPALIRKCVEATEAGADHIEVWGDESPPREFLYVDDAAEGILLATERYDSSEPVNLGSGVEISMKDLAEMIVR